VLMSLTRLAVWATAVEDVAKRQREKTTRDLEKPNDIYKILSVHWTRELL